MIEHESAGKDGERLLRTLRSQLRALGGASLASAYPGEYRLVRGQLVSGDSMSTLEDDADVTVELEIITMADGTPSYKIEIARAASQDSLPADVLAQARDYGMTEPSDITDFDGVGVENVVYFDDSFLTRSYKDIKYWTKLRYRVDGVTGAYVPQRSYSYTLNDLLITHEILIGEELDLAQPSGNDLFDELVIEPGLLNGTDKDFDYDRAVMKGILVAARRGRMSYGFLRQTRL